MEYGQLQLEVGKVSGTVSQLLATSLTGSRLIADALQEVQR